MRGFGGRFLLCNSGWVFCSCGIVILGSACADESKANYLLFWHTQFLVDNLSNQVNELQASGAKFVSKPGNVQQIVRDPDGHALEIYASANSGITLR